MRRAIFIPGVALRSTPGYSRFAAPRQQSFAAQLDAHPPTVLTVALGLR
jgi:hypothetical protein